ncbi:MAG: histidine kinase N-terminal 7TM domain-containing protein [Bacillota bacterium]|nr:histidine kinase N-terminal 7TM domain-containing protein [Bacillota bacterium]
MNQLLNRKKRRYGFIAILILVMGLFRGMEKPNGYLFDLEFILNFVLNTALLLTWLMAIYIRIIHKKIRRYLLSIGMLMFFWLLVRTVKYRVFSVFPNMNFLWYLFYIPIVLIPLLSYYTARTVGQKEDCELPIGDKLFLVPAGLTILGVLSNDWHRMAFVFEGGTYVGMSYGYGPFYYLSYMFSFFFAIASIWIMYQKSRRKESKDKIYLPFIIVIAFLFYSAFYNLNQNHKALQFLDITIAYCITTIAFWESCIQIGLIPSNSNYNEFFKSATFHTAILDVGGKLQYSGGEARTLDSQGFEMLRRDGILAPDPGSRIYISEITGGYVLWEERLDSLLNLIDQLESVNGKIESEILLLQNQMNIDEKRIKLKEKTRLYELIKKNTHGQMHKIRRNLAEIAECGNDVIKWWEINICATYIKRYSNLVFICEDSEHISLQDLELAIRESLQNLKKMGIHQGFTMHGAGELEQGQAFQLYRSIQSVIEASFQQLSEIYIVLRTSEDYVNLSMLLSGKGLSKAWNEEEMRALHADPSMLYNRYEEDGDSMQVSVRVYKG